MIHIQKTELKERTFIPYQFTITVSSEDDHRKLQEAARKLKTSSYFFGKHNALSCIGEQILNHIK